MRALESHTSVAQPEVHEPHTLIRESFRPFASGAKNAQFVDSLADYSALFKGEQLVGDNSVLYLAHYEEFLRTYASLAGEPPPVIVILREPVSRAWSAFNYARLLRNPYEGESDFHTCLLYTSPSPRDQRGSRMPSSA